MDVAYSCTQELTLDLSPSERGGPWKSMQPAWASSWGRCSLHLNQAELGSWQKGMFPNYAPALPFPLPPPTAPPKQHSVICHRCCPSSPLWSLPSLHSDSHTLTIIPHCCFLSHLFACLCFFTAPQWANVVLCGFFFPMVGSTLWNWVGVLYIWWDPQGFSLWHSRENQPTLPGQQPQDHMVSFRASFLPATSQGQLALLMTHPRGFYKGQVSGPSPEEKQPCCCESEPQRAPCLWRPQQAQGALPGPCPLHMRHTFPQTFTPPPPRLTPASVRWSYFAL